MASVNGVEVKNVKIFEGMEGPTAQGSVYLNGRKLGLWSQDSHGGCDRYDFDERLLDTPFYRYKSAMRNMEVYKYLDIDSLMFSVYCLNSLEKALKKEYRKNATNISYFWIFEAQSCEYAVYNIKSNNLASLYSQDKKAFEQLIKNKFVDIRKKFKEQLLGANLSLFNYTDATISYGILSDKLGEYGKMSLDIEVGTEDGGVKEKIKHDSEISQRILELSKGNGENNDGYTKFTKSDRFNYENMGNMVKITDTQTNKNIMIPLYSLSEVKKVLDFFFEG